ncbi:MAG: cupredoxin domain-containing protein [Dehalococcoidia bacterium]|nr:cupredoxin domain-containing protein [Dehalococcoidia bacterium]
MHFPRALTGIAVLAVPGLALAFAACGGDDNTSSVTPTIETRAPASPTATTAAATTVTGTATDAASAVAGAQAVTVAISAQDTSFDKQEIDAPAGAHVTVQMTNKDNIIHNIAFYKDSSANEPIAVGDLFKGPNVTKDLSFDAPKQPGTYYFHCDVHPDQMHGTFKVQ